MVGVGEKGEVVLVAELSRGASAWVNSVLVVGVPGRSLNLVAAGSEHSLLYRFRSCDRLAPFPQGAGCSSVGLLGVTPRGVGGPRVERAARRARRRRGVGLAGPSFLALAGPLPGSRPGGRVSSGRRLVFPAVPGAYRSCCWW